MTTVISSDASPLDQKVKYLGESPEAVSLLRL